MNTLTKIKKISILVFVFIVGTFFTKWIVSSKVNTVYSNDSYVESVHADIPPAYIYTGGDGGGDGCGDGGGGGCGA